LSKSQILFSSFSITVVSSVIVVLQIIDSTSGDTWASNIASRNSLNYLILYSIITCASLTTQCFLLAFSSQISFRIKKATTKQTWATTCIYVISHIIVIVLIAYLVIQQVSTSSYHMSISELIVGISFIASAAILISLAFTFIKSFFASRNKLVGIYALAIIALSIQQITAFTYVEINFLNSDQFITPVRNPWSAHVSSSSVDITSFIYQISKAISFITIWISSVLLTIQYSKRWRIKYWSIVSIPLIYFLIQYPLILLTQTGTLSTLLMSREQLFLYAYNFVFNTVSIGTGILFGISFFIVAKSVKHVNLKFYLTISGAGIMILFSSNVATNLVLAPFPAWGIVSVSLILPASYLLLIGLDSSIHDIGMDRSIRSYLSTNRNQFKLFLSLGSTEASKLIERKIRDISKKISDNIGSETMFKPAPGSEDVNEYVKEVLAELKKSKMTNVKSDEGSSDPK